MVEQKLKIRQEIIDQASQCPKGIACLSDEKVLCKPQGRIGDLLLFVRNKRHRSCPYAVHVGEKCVCKCPVRIEICKNYNR